MELDTKELAAIADEVKKHGDNVKALKDAVQKDLHDARQIADEALVKVKALANLPAETKAQIERGLETVVQKQDALQSALTKAEEADKAAAKRMEEIETALARAPKGGQDAKDAVKAMADARAFFEAKAVAEGKGGRFLNAPDSEINIADFQLWEKTFAPFLRKGPGAWLDGKALSVGSSPDGGWMVPTARSQQIITKVYESSPIRRLATVETIGTDSLEIPVDEGEFGFGWVGEVDSRSETTTSQFGWKKIVVHEMYAKPRVSQKMLEDASINIENWMANKIADKFTRAEATAFVGGDGVTKPRGFTTYPNGTSRDQIEQVVSGAAGAVTADGLMSLTFALKDFYLANASFLMKRSTQKDVALLKDGNGVWLWRPGLDNTRSSSLLGYPVFQADDMAAVAADALAIAFGDFRAGYTIVDRLGITVLRDPYSNKPWVEFYSRRRVGGDVTTFEAIKLQKLAAS